MNEPPGAAWTGGAAGRAEVDLRHHGDADTDPRLIDLAVNVRKGPQPAWLSAALAEAMTQLGSYPDLTQARHAVGRRHRRAVDEVLLTGGAAEAFVLLARALRPRRAVVVHPQFTEPEAALRAAGHAVERLVLHWPFVLDPAQVPADADLVMLGNPTNPTSVSHPASVIAALARPGRTLVVDEAFADCIPGEPDSLAGETSLPGLVVVRSLTKTWGLAGLRCGYLLAPAPLVTQLQNGQPLWPLSVPALAACTACSTPEALALAERWARELSVNRDHLVRCLSEVDGVQVVPNPVASFVLLRHQGGDEVRLRLREAGFATRRGDTFPGLGASWLRVAVRDPVTSTSFAAALARAVTPPVLRVGVR